MDFTLSQDTSSNHTTSTTYNYHGYSTPSFSSHKQFWLRRYHAWTKAEHTDHDHNSVYDGIHSDDHIPSSLYDENEPHPQPEEADDSSEQMTFDPTEPGVYPRMGNLSYAQDENWARMDWMLRGVKMWIVTRSLFQWALASTPDTCSSIRPPHSSSRRHSVSTQSTPSVYSDIDLDDTTPFDAPTTSTIPDDGNFTANDNQDETDDDDDDVQEFVGYSEDLESDLESDATLVDSEQNSPLGLSNSKQLPPLFISHHHHLSHSTSSSSSSPTSAQSITPSSPFSTSVFLPTDDDFGYSERRYREEEVEGEFNYMHRIRMGQVDQWKYLLGISTTYSSSSSSSSKPLISVGNHLYEASSALIDGFLSSSSSSNPSRSISSSSPTTSRPSSSSSSSSYNSNPTHPPLPTTTTRSLLVDDLDSEEFDIENYDYDHDFERDFDFDFERDCAGRGYGYIPSRPQSPKFFFLDEDDDEDEGGEQDGEEGLIYNNTLHHHQHHHHTRQRSLSPKWRFHDDDDDEEE